MRLLLLTTALCLSLPMLAGAQEMDHSQMSHSAPMAMDTTQPTGASTSDSTEATATPNTAQDSAGQTTPTQLAPDMNMSMPEGMSMPGMNMPEGMPHDHAAMMAAMAGQGEHSPASDAHDMTLLSPAGLPVAAADRTGNSELTGDVIDGVRVFQISAAPIAWPITDKTTVYAYAYNGQVPGPLFRVTAGEKIRVVLTNNLPEATTIHWHGVDVPVEMDGVPGISQPPVKPGEKFTYEFTVPDTPGTFFYHTHVMPDKQQALGLYGAFIIEPKVAPAKPAWDSEHTLMLGEWTVRDGGNLPSMPMEGMFPNYFTINGKAWDSIEPFTAKVGERVLFRLVGSGSFSHPIHLHGTPFKVIAVDGHPLPATQQMVRDTLTVNPGERYDIVWTPTRPGTWLLHCHINHHTMNDGQESASGMGGMAVAVDVMP